MTYYLFMPIFQAILLGIIEGLTEFLPISSTGHLLLAQNMIGYKDTAEIFTVVVQIGALMAVLWHYRLDLWQKIAGLIKRDNKVMKFWVVWITATIPATIVGLLISGKLTNFSSLLVIAIALIIGGIIILLIETYYKVKPSKSEPQFNKISIKQALAVGCYQILALLPGVSRSGATIMGGMLSGFDRLTATTFSFYMSMPILLMASLYKLVQGYNDMDTISGGRVALLVGVLASFVSSLIVISWLLKYIAKHNFKVFAFYRIGLGLLIIMWLFIN